ncbi:MAG TPA: cyclase family protein [Vicinamibacterales bacterium]|nr:cyclase family protein [Vicinamibacterales bacterium]
MTKVRIAVVALGAYLIGALSSTVTVGQDKWYPSRWGAADQRGAANRITPAKVLDAKAMITKGSVYQLGRAYEAGMPLFGSRHYSLKVPYMFAMGGKNQAGYHDDIISGELSQIGTQFDGLGHVGIGELFYNGNKRADFATPDGLKKLGVENVGAIVTRGVLIDVAKYKGVPRLNAPYAITVADLTGALQRQKVEIRPGDVVLIHTGWGSLWMKDNATFGASSPGIGVQAGEWLAGKEVVVVGSDNWGVEAFPNPDPNLSAPVHQLLLARNGIYLHENLATEGLARDSVYEFAYVFAPLRLKGATGSPGNPIAIR